MKRAIASLVLLISTVVVADVGYVVTPNYSRMPGPNGTVQWHAHGSWWAIIIDSTGRFFIWRKDLPTPSSPGAVGGWTQTGTMVDPKSSTRIDLWYNAAEDVVHVLRKRTSRNVARYNEFSWNPATQTYDLDTALADVTAGFEVCTPTSECALVGDGTGQAFVANESGGIVTLLFTTVDRATWSSISLDSNVPSDNSPTLIPYNDSVTGPGVALAYWKGSSQMVLRLHDDDAGDTAADWSEETVIASGRRSDNHNIIRSNGGDLHIAFKDGSSDGIYYTQRIAGGSWAAPTLVSLSGGVRTAPSLALVGSDVFVFWYKDGTSVYRSSDQVSTSFGTETQALVDDDDRVGPVTPKQNSLSGNGLLVLGSGVQTWYNILGLQTEPSTWYQDLDGDGFGDPNVSIQDFTQPPGFVVDATDCDDTVATINPGATEFCDGVDNDCDGTIDEDDATDASTWYRDADGDGFGNAAIATLACAQPAGFVTDATDCDDSEATVNPAAPEICDGLDNDCNGSVDEGVAGNAPTWYRDLDSDGFGDSTVSIVSCSQPVGFVASPGDCDDNNSTTFPGAAQLCNGINDVCDDPNWPVVPAAESDTDGDGFRVCDNDCNDGSAAVNPAAIESCNGIDDDCNGLVDEDAAGQDSDIDGVFNLCDNCPNDQNTGQLDADMDQLGDACDNCPIDPNPDQADLDADGAGNVCDDDDDSDGVLDVDDNCPLDANAGQEDRDLDGIGDACDTALVKQAIVVARCTGGVPRSELDLPDFDAASPSCRGTDVKYATLDFGDAAIQSASTHLQLPSDWVGDLDVALRWFTGETTGSTIWRLELGCAAVTSTDMAQGPSLNPALSVATNNGIQPFSLNQTSFESVPTAGCSAGNLLFLRVSRDIADSNPGSVALVEIEVTLQRGQ